MGVFFTHMNFTIWAGINRGRSGRKGSFIPLPPPVLLSSFISWCAPGCSVSSSPGAGCIHPCFHLLLPQWQQMVVQLVSKIALGCSKNYHSFSSGAQPTWPHSRYLFTIHLKSPLTSQSVVKWNKHWFLTRCMNISTISVRGRKIEALETIIVITFEP